MRGHSNSFATKHFARDKTEPSPRLIKVATTQSAYRQRERYNRLDHVKCKVINARGLLDSLPKLPEGSQWL